MILCGCWTGFRSVVFLSLLTAILAGGCGGARLLTDPPPVAVRGGGNRENSCELFERYFRFDPAGRATVRTHSIVRVGAEGSVATLAVYDGSMTRLTRYEARIIYADGSLERFDISDLASSTMSNSRVIAERSVRHVGVTRIPGPGDLVESIAEHELAFPQLGMQFSPAEAGDRVLHAACLIEVPRGDTVLSSLANDTARTSPSITRNDVSTIYTFDWYRYEENKNRHRFSRRNDAPQLLAVASSHGARSWREFGDWYLGVLEGKLRADERIAAAVKGIVNERMPAKEKMFAIARFCQANIRYEQAYLEGGEIVPNEAALIFQHRYGDCKDYSTLMVALAREAGLDPDLVLCRRGTGYAFYDTLPVTQFNHMIVHWRDGESDFWFDGTNPPEAIGIASDDLINGKALILKPGKSHIATIGEMPDNLLSVSGTFRVDRDDLIGSMRISLQGQYAVAFLGASRQANAHAMKARLTRWVEQSVASGITVSDLRWRSDSLLFQVVLPCKFPNALWRVGGGEYIRFDKIFNRLLPQNEPGPDSAAAFYYPGYARVKVDVTIPDLESSFGEPFRWEDRYELPTGPFDQNSRDNFLQKYRTESEKASRVIHVQRKG